VKRKSNRCARLSSLAYTAHTAAVNAKRWHGSTPIHHDRTVITQNAPTHRSMQRVGDTLTNPLTGCSTRWWLPPTDSKTHFESPQLLPTINVTNLSSVSWSSRRLLSTTFRYLLPDCSSRDSHQVHATSIIWLCSRDKRLLLRVHKCGRFHEPKPESDQRDQPEPWAPAVRYTVGRAAVCTHRQQSARARSVWTTFTLTPRHRIGNHLYTNDALWSTPQQFPSENLNKFRGSI
jgi:hypothetical protein